MQSLQPAWKCQRFMSWNCFPLTWYHLAHDLNYSNFFFLDKTAVLYLSDGLSLNVGGGGKARVGGEIKSLLQTAKMSMLTQTREQTALPQDYIIKWLGSICSIFTCLLTPPIPKPGSWANILEGLDDLLCHHMGNTFQLQALCCRPAKRNIRANVRRARVHFLFILDQIQDPFPSWSSNMRIQLLIIHTDSKLIVVSFWIKQYCIVFLSCK